MDEEAKKNKSRKTFVKKTNNFYYYHVLRYEESLLPYYYCLGDELRIFMTEHYLKSARNFTIHQPSGRRV